MLSLIQYFDPNKYLMLDVGKWSGRIIPGSWVPVHPTTLQLTNNKNKYRTAGIICEAQFLRTIEFPF